MKIVRLTAENIKKLRAVEITPEGNLVLIGGRNSQGKTSVLDTISLALDAASAVKRILRPIREGQDHARIDMDLGDYTVSRTFTANDHSYLTVRGKDGTKFSTPQTLLDSFIGTLSFDPLAFARMSPGEQRATLLQFVDLGIGLPALDAQSAEAYAQRTALNRDLKQQQAALATLPAPAPDLPETEVSAAALLAQIQQEQDQRMANAALRQRLEALRGKAIIAKDGIAGLDKEIQTLEARLQALRTEREREQKDYDALLAEGKNLAAQVEKLTDPDLTGLQQQLATVEQRNAAIRDGQKYRTLAVEVNTLRTRSENLTTRLAEIERTKADTLQKARFPVDGLGFSEDGVTFKGIPFQQASSSEQLRVSLAMAMALNPKLRVIRITDGSLLDQDSLAIIQQMAQDKDYQVWLEVVSDTVGIQIEDGMVKGAIPPPTPTRKPGTPKPQAATPASIPDPAPPATPAASSPSGAPAAPPVHRPATGLAAVAPPLPLATAPAGPQPPRPRVPLRTPVYAQRSRPKP